GQGRFQRRQQAGLPGARARGPPGRVRPGPRRLRPVPHRRARSPPGVRVPGGDEPARRAAGAGAMKYVDEYRDRTAARKLADAVARAVTRPWTVMEVCGGQTHTIVKYGIDRVLPPQIELVHGPGCPVCVTSLEMIDRAHAIASRPDVTFC